MASKENFFIVPSLCKKIKNIITEITKDFYFKIEKSLISLVFILTEKDEINEFCSALFGEQIT